MPLSPAVRKLVEEHGVDPAEVPASGKDGRLTKGDVLAYVEARGEAQKAPSTPKAEAPAPAPSPKSAVPRAAVRARNG
jgi:2-oxoglutarate dehydrogenase E2 component (dihydrolipoamide succinyltransferase)